MCFLQEWMYQLKAKTTPRRGFFEFGRGSRIRTYDLYVPNVALYQAELYPDSLAVARFTRRAF